MNTNITSNLWTKNWSGNWGLLFGSLYGDIYTKGLQSLAGKHFDHNIIVFEAGVSSNYLVQNELRDYCNYLTTLIQKDETLPQQWCEQVTRNTDTIFTLMKRLDAQTIFSQNDYDDLQEARLQITTANFSIKKVIDYLPENLKEKYLELFSRVRVYTEPVYNETDRLLKKIAVTVCDDRLSEQEIAVLTKEELQTFFIHGSLPNPSSLRARYTGCALVFDTNGTGQMLQGSEYTELMDTIAPKSSKPELRGIPAYKGKATGRVRIVLDPAQCRDFQKGDVLVAGMTRPEYLSLMRDSCAFVTDAGGLLSHAAIVAREMKKPCIVGTENATKILKDGDMVEVDAEHGIIRIIR